MENQMKCFSFGVLKTLNVNGDKEREGDGHIYAI